MSEKMPTKEVANIRFKSAKDAVDAYVGVLEAYAADPSEVSAEAVFEVKNAIDSQYGSGDEFGDNEFEDTWVHAATKGDSNRVELAEAIAKQIEAEREGGTFNYDSDDWDHDAYEEYHDSF